MGDPMRQTKVARVSATLLRSAGRLGEENRASTRRGGKGNETHPYHHPQPIWHSQQSAWILLPVSRHLYLPYMRVVVQATTWRKTAESKH